MSLNSLLKNINQCRLCESKLPLEPKPIVQLSSSATVLLIGQAPGRVTHDKGVPFKDASGDRLREWLGIDEDTFYDKNKIAIMPMAFCFPGKLNNGSGDKPPPTICAKTWHDSILTAMPNLKLTILIGRYAAKRYAPECKDLTEAIVNYSIEGTSKFVLPHPSPRNNIWLAKNDWFETKTLPMLRQRLKTII